MNMTMMKLLPTVLALLPLVSAFTNPTYIVSNNINRQTQHNIPASTVLFSTPNDDQASALSQKFGGYTSKQRLREEVESPFRKVRLAFFGFSSISAATALYFSALTALKANMGFEGVIPLDEALIQVAINAGGAIGFALLANRELKVGQANLDRIAKGGLLARLPVEPAMEGESKRTLKEYRRASRVVIAAGGKEYINQLSLSLNSDQLADTNTLSSSLANVDIVIVPVLLNEDKYQPVDTQEAWENASPSETDRNFDCTRANEVVAFPSELSMWNEYLKSDVETAKGQGFDVLSKGITITVKKNGRILRRATGLPPFGDFIGVMEVADGSKFGMPGDGEKYGTD